MMLRDADTVRRENSRSNFQYLVGGAINNVLELVFPSNIYCIACGAIIDQSRPYALCDRCAQVFHWANGKACMRCGCILQETYRHAVCLDCRENPHVFTRGYQCVQYGLRERDLLLALKYGGKAFIGEKIAAMMADRLAPEALAIDLVVPVPMHRAKQRKRGYNQAALIAGHLAKKLSAPCAPDMLLRTAETPAMSRLSPEERRRNLEGAIRVAPGKEKRVVGAAILLVDDVYTTGSTVDACGAALFAAEAADVRFISFAGGANRMMQAAE